jgi:hypothetical protein
MYDRFVCDVQYGGLYDGFVRAWKWIFKSVDDKSQTGLTKLSNHEQDLSKIGETSF